MHPTMRDSEDLAEARRAWRAKREAESQLARLARYTRLTPGMKDDRNRWSKQAYEAEQILTRILGATDGNHH